MSIGFNFFGVASLAGAVLLVSSCTSEIDTGELGTVGGSGVAPGVGGANGTQIDGAGALPSCGSEQADCGGVCVDLQSDGANCGQCGALCASGQVCSNGTCTTACSDLTPTVCGQSCVDLASNAQNCGSCGSPCAAGQSCVGGSCKCAIGMALCGASCVNLASDAQNCGACGTNCTAGASCAQGVCEEVNTVTTTSTTGGFATTGFSSTSGTATTGASGTTGGLGTNTTGGGVNTSTTGGVDTSTTGGVDTSTTGGAAGVSFAQVADIIASTCAATVCHGGRERPSLLNDGALYGTMMGTTVRQCGSSTLVSANDAAGSSLLMLLNRQCGNFVMPEGCQSTPCISADDMATITAWIEEGAPNN